MHMLPTRCTSPTHSKSRFLLLALATLVLGVFALPASAQSTGKWSEVVGRKIVNRQGVTLGYVSDSAVDLENGRYVGMMVKFGGFLGIGRRTIVVPPGAVVDEGVPGCYTLDMDEAHFRAAPTFRMSQTVGPPYAVQVQKVYNYFGQSPYFTTEIQANARTGEKLGQLGYVQEGSNILRMPVDNLQGLQVGVVMGLRDLNRTTGKLGGVVISPSLYNAGDDKKIVQGQDLRYNSRHDRLRLNDSKQSFANAPDFTFTGGGHFTQENPNRPGTPPPPLIQGNSASDKRITTQINNAILGDSELSHYSKSIEVATVHGKAMLRGRVQSTRGRDAVVGYAVAAAGKGNVTAQIEVSPSTAAERATDKPVAR
ncbi:hypothetical protein BH09VER1_BH09VER1_49240 [soil metagenome]